MIFVVLGMHKSGTTLVSQILHHSGINMGEFDESVSYDKGNKYERQSTLDLDMDILGTDSYEVLDLRRPDAPDLSPTHRSRMREIIQDCEERFRDWGFKDPRSALIYQLWREELPQHKIIAVFRDPAQVWPRFKWHGRRKYHTNFSRADSYLQRWWEHNANILRFLRETEMDFLVIDYHKLMTTDDEFQRLQDFVGRPLQDRRKPELYRSKARRDLFIRYADLMLRLRRGQTSHALMRELDWFRR